MKKKLLIFTILALIFSVLFISCGDKAVVGISIVDGTFDREYELGETVDYSRIRAEVTYNDGEVITVEKEWLELGTVDTSTVGTKKFTVTYGGYTLTIDVVVKSSAPAGGDTPPAPTLSSISIDPSSVANKIFVGQTLDTSAVKAVATYSDNSVKTINTSSLTVSSVDTSTAGQKTLTVTYEGKSATLTVNVIGVKAIEMMDLATEIFVGDTINTAGSRALVTYTDDTNGVIAADKLTFGSFSSATAGTATLTVTYLDYTAEIPVTVKAPAAIIAIEVDAISLGNLIVVPDGEDLDLVAIKNSIVVNAVYGYTDGTVTGRVTVTDKDALTLSEANESSNRYLVVSYGSFTTKVLVTETAPVVDTIEINEASLNKTVIIGGMYTPGAFTVTAHYSNGTNETVTYGVAAVSVSTIDTATAGEKTLTVTYKDKTATATVYVLGVNSITVVDAPELKVKVGETLTPPALSILVTYKHGTYTQTETVAVTAAMIGAIDTATAGNKSFKITYLGAEATVPYTVIGIESVLIDGDSIETTVTKGGSLNTSTIKVKVKYTDGTYVDLDADDVIIDTSAIDFSAAGTYNLKVTYKGVTGTIEILVDDKGYTVMGVFLPQSYTDLSSKKNKFMNSSSSRGYVVGDDNAFKFTLQLAVLDANLEEVAITNYTSVSTVYIIEGANERLLSGDELLYYVAIDETKNEFDFTQAAVGKTFKIKSRPGFGISAGNYDKFTKSIVVNVEDAYNVYSAKELHVMVNYSDDDIKVDSSNTKPQLEVVKAFLAENNIAHPGEIAGVVLHNDIHVTKDDLPKPYLFDTGLKDNYGNVIYDLNDYIAVYSHAVSSSNPTFNIYGNYFTIFSNDIPAVNKAQADEDGGCSHSTLFTIGNLDAERDGDVANFDKTPYTTNVYDLYLMDDDPNDPQNASSVRSKLGLIGMKVQHQNVNVDNMIAERYYISFFADRDYLTVNLNNANFYNAWQNHIFVWSKNDLQSMNDAVCANHTPVTVNITNSDINTCGGPVIISQTNAPGEARNQNSGAIVNIDDATEIWTYINSSAIWFDAFGASQQAADIQALSALFSTYNRSFVVKDPVDPNNGKQYTGDFMNIIMLNMPSGYKIEDLMSPQDIDGSLSIGGNTVFEMRDGKNSAYEGLINTLWMIASMAGDFPPAFQSSASGTDEITWTNGTYLLDSNIDFSTGQPVATPVSGSSDLLDGEYLTIFYGSMGLLMGNYHSTEAAGN